MLYIYVDSGYGEPPKEFESYVSAYFDDVYEAEWFEDAFVQRIIQEIDETVVVGVGNVGVNLYNATLGNIPPQHLSSGCKGLILLYKEDIKINGDRLGGNCIPLLLEIAEQKDVFVSFSHYPPFPDQFSAVLMNWNKPISMYKEFGDAMLEVRYG